MNKILLLLGLVATLSFATVVAPSTYTGKGSSSPLTTKGDLYTRSSTGDSALAIGANGLVLVADSSAATGMAWTAVSGTGDVVGPASSTDNAICRFDGTSGKAVQSSGLTITDGDLLRATQQVGIGGAPSTDKGLFINLTSSQMAGTSQTIVSVDSTFSSAATSGGYGFGINLSTQNASFTLPFMLNFSAGGMSKGASATVTRSVNYYGSDQTVATNNAFFADNVSFSGNWLLNFSSTRASTLGGALTVGGALTASSTAAITGAITNSALTASRVVVTDGSKVLSSSTMSQTKLESLTGEQIDAFVETPSAKTYTLRGKARYAGTINKVYLKTASGTITAKLQIAGVDVTSCTAIAVSSTPSDTTCTAANTFAVGDAITLVTSSNSSSADLVVSVDVTR